MRPGSPDLASPIVVGALGGSGTRSVAGFLLALGVDLGHCRNRAEDERLFSRLFRRPRWFARVGADGAHDRLRTYVSIRAARNAGEALDRLAALGDPVQLLGGEVLTHFEASFAPLGAPWGWKEPNSHVYAEVLLEHFPGLRLVHVVRDGLDMAFSANTAQLGLWGRRFGVDRPDDVSLVPSAQFDYWASTTERMLALAAADPARVCVLDYEGFCDDPAGVGGALARWAGLTPEPDRVEEAAEPVVPQRSRGRANERLDSRFGDERVSRAGAIAERVAMASPVGDGGYPRQPWPPSAS